MNPFPRLAEPDLDPLPSLTERYRRSGAFDRNPLDSNRLTPSAVASMRGTIQSVVSGLQTDDRPFRAMFGKTSTAATDLKARLVYIGTKAMDDTTISDGRLAAIMTGLAYHEVAHINHDRVYHAHVVKSLSGHDLASLTSDVHNIGQDIRIEARIKSDRPGYAETLAVTMWYVTKGHVGRKASLTGLSTMAARNQFFAAVRAPWQIADWTDALTALRWGADWASRMTATDKRSEITDLISEALDMIQSWTLGPKGPKPPIIDEPPPIDDDETDPPPVDDDDPDDDDPPPVDEPPPGPDDDIDPPPVDDDDPDGPDGPDGPDDDTDPPPDDEDPEDPPKPGRGTDGGKDTEGGDDDDEPTPDIGDVSNKWTDDPEIDVNIDRVSPDNAAGEEGSERTFDLEDLEFPACAADALKGANDNTYGAVAARIEKSREEGNTRVIRTPGWPDRTVKRAWDMPNK